ncbi:MAG: polyribonucleotide nucleotidyltransferase [Actinomycetota bacterium]|jgi:polyribonucleotide nucleotidyltransferase|nr:polyribonucleotide nucleotidyltransferase [Actinomycetota bacterium]
MAEAVVVSTQLSGTDKTLSFEAGKLAQQADGAVVGRLGDTMVLLTATAAKTVKEGIDFFPLTVDIEERMYAVGRIPGSFFRREGRATDAATLTSRLIDRPLRPCFADDFRNEVHVVGTILGADLTNPHDVLAINAASAALMISGIPFHGPVGAVRIAFDKEGKWVPHPSYQDGDSSSFELVVAGRENSDGSDIAIIMVEAGGTESSWNNYQEGAPLLTESEIADGLELAKTWIRESIELQRRLVQAHGGKPRMEYVPQIDYSDEVYEAVKEVGLQALSEANVVLGKADRDAKLNEAMAMVSEKLSERFEGREGQIKSAIKSLNKYLVRKRIVEDGVRIDGRDLVTIRPLSCEVELIPTAHGTGLFNRGETQVLTFCTLGMPKMTQMLDSISTDEFKRYIHHYNFPPFSTGEVGFMRGPKRREIGHGLLAERALLPVVPPQSEFPYALRLVSEVLSSNGSTSMASVCGSTLSLMDAGVPIKAPVAGIAMGLVLAEGKYVTLTDILGAEDAFGDMDFKVAGTSEFVTALQLDTKIDGIPAEVLGQALRQAKDARLKVLDVMLQVISEPRSAVKGNAPKIISFEVPLEKIGEIIGPKGKSINAIQQETGAEVGIEDDGTVGIVTIGAKDPKAVDEARRRVYDILEPPKVELGANYTGKVVSIAKFGAFVNILPGRDGLLHISKLGGGKRVERVEDYLQMGQELTVHVDDIDAAGKISLSLVTDGIPKEGSTESAEPTGAEAKDKGVVSRDEPAEARPPSESSMVSFEAHFDEELRSQYGDLGPGPSPTGRPVEREGGHSRGPRRSGRRDGRR